MTGYNEIYTSYTMADGRVFEAKRGKVTADIGYEDHGMFVMKMRYDWGSFTSMNFILDYCEDYDIEESKRVRKPQGYLFPLMVSMVNVFNANNFNVGTFGGITEAEAYILFSEDLEQRNIPLGLVNIRDTQKVFIFKDLLDGYVIK